jgi:tRNA-2-methylthio-N6-dimethylallyladenosine synthase
MKKYCIYTYGCQMNAHDSEKLAGILKASDYTETKEPKEADIIVFNTCSIRQKAEQKFFSQLGKINKLKNKKPGLKITVAGCIAQQEGARILKRAPYVNYIMGPQNIHAMLNIIKDGAQKLNIEENPSITENDFPADRKDRVRALINIMYGCNNFCSYCIVPYTRGREISRTSTAIINEIKKLAEAGFKEVTLLGQNVNSYKSDCAFPELLKRLNEISGIQRIRFLTSHPKDLSDELVFTIKNLDKVCEHLHLPLQSGSTKILGLMNRKYTYDDYIKKIEKLRKEIPEIAITSDIIAAFPQETDEDHKATLSALREIRFDGIYAFKFSPRPGTKAATMQDRVSDTVGSERLSEILEVQENIIIAKNKELEGTIQEVLVETADENNYKIFCGRTRTGKVVNISHDRRIQIGDTVKIKIETASKHSLIGTVNIS